MIVKNNTVSIIGIQNTKRGGFTTLLPGLNTIDKEQWEAFIANPARRHQLAEGELEVVEEDELTTLKEKSVKDAIALVKSTVRKEMLESWVESENRKQVLDAIEKQLEAIQPPKKTNPDEPDPSKEESEEP